MQKGIKTPWKGQDDRCDPRPRPEALDRFRRVESGLQVLVTGSFWLVGGVLEQVNSTITFPSFWASFISSDFSPPDNIPLFFLPVDSWYRGQVRLNFPHLQVLQNLQLSPPPPLFLHLLDLHASAFPPPQLCYFKSDFCTSFSLFADPPGRLSSGPCEGGGGGEGGGGIPQDGGKQRRSRGGQSLMF